MVWADRIVAEIEKRFAKEIAAKRPLLIRDEKTLSGRVHVGSLRGILLHGLVAQVLTEKGISNEFKFELNDADPMDGLPTQVSKEVFEPHMGKPLFAVPTPSEGHWALLAASAPNYPMVFGEELKGVVAPLKLPISFYTLRPLYEAGKFNECITEALNHAEEIRSIYAEVSGGKKPQDWNPLQVICEKCGKMGTTQVVAWDPSPSSGQAPKGMVTYECRKDLVTWASGCSHRGTVNPFDGRAKLPWKVEWAAKWKVLGVNIEGAGKDHSAAGGSRAIAARISEEIFKYPNPFDIPYEFFNIGGKKMSASKGLGASAKEVSDLLPPVLTKLLMIRKQPNQPIDFDPSGPTIPHLFDEYDRLSDHYFKRHPEPDADFARTFALTQLAFPKAPEDLWHMRFTTLSFVLQMPHLKIEEEAAKLKDSPLTEGEKKSLNERAYYVEQWLSEHAPPEYKYEILKELPKNLELDADQKKALTKVSAVLADPQLLWEGPKIHEAIHSVKAELGIAPKKLFEPLYQIFLGRSSGPQVGWFLSTFERKEAIKRIGLVL